MCDAHVMIVHHVGQMIGGKLIALHDHRIAFSFAHIMLHAAIDEILQRFLVLGQFEAYAVWSALSQQWLQLFCIQMATFVIVARHLTCAQRLLPQQLQATLCAETAIGMAGLYQALHCIAVEEEEKS